MFGISLMDQTAKSQPKQKDVVIEIIGHWGKYQYWIAFLLFMSKFPIAWNQLAIVFYATPINYECGESRGGNEGVRSKHKGPCPCPYPIYDKSVFTNNMIMEFNLICDRRHIISYTQSVFQCGSLTGSMGFGMLADVYGRKFPFLTACVIQFAFGMAGVYATNVYLFIMCRFFVGLAMGGIIVVSFVILMEFVGPEYREIVSALFHIPFNVGSTSLSLISYFFRDWRHFQMVISAPCVLYFFYFITIPESPRWLIMHGRTNEAIKILTTCAKWNRRPTDHIKSEVETFYEISSRNAVKKGTTIDLFKTPNIRRNILSMGWNWCTCSFCFYGVSQYIGQLGGNIFTNFAISTSMVTLGTLCSIPLMSIMGRKTLIMICHAVCFACLFALAFADGALAVGLASFGTVSSFVVFVVVYLYASELFPTVVRNAAVGFSSMCARIGSIIAPFIVDLKYTDSRLPPLILGVAPFIAFFVTILMPETKGCHLMTTIEEAENYGTKTIPPRQNTTPPETDKK